MNIKEYYDDYKNQKYSNVLNDVSKTSLKISDFFNDCIKGTLLNKEDVLAWHNMFMEYVDLPDAVYWVRYYENASRDKNTNRFNTRRACITKFDDGFSYVFVSNYDAHEIFNMISKGVVPTAQEFLSLMKSYSFPMHYDPNGACEESDMAAYPNIGTVFAGALTMNRWYLAHINDIKGEYIRNNGTSRKLNKVEIDKIFPKGVIDDWKIDTLSNKKVRKLSYSLTDDEKAIVKANFLRFVDPLNYFLVPGISYQTNSVMKAKRSIGEYANLVTFMREKYKQIYGSQEVSEFCQKALLPDFKITEDGSSVINVTYGRNIVKKSAPKASAQIPNKSVKNPIFALSASSLNQKDDIIKKIGKTFTAKNELEELFVNIILYLNKNGQLTQDDMNMLTSDDSKETFGIKYIAIVRADSNYDSNRYLKSSLFTFNGNDYLITNDWYAKDTTFDKIVAWANTKGIR